MTADPAWFGDRAFLPPDNYIVATYSFETEEDPREVAANLAREQSTAQWKRVGVEEDFRPEYGAKVVALRVTGVESRPRFPSPFHQGAKFVNAEASIAHPIANFGAKFPNLLTVLCGEGTFFTPGISAIRLVDVEFPASYLAQFPGPQFGVAGLRDLLDVRERPFFIGVVKPNVGLPAAEFAKLAFEAWVGGLDAAKDDELLADVPYSPLALRAKLCGARRREAEAATGEKKMYVANITDEVDRLAELHDVAIAGGANAVMLNALPMGLSAVRALRKRSRVPLLSHFDMVAAFSRAPGFGVSEAVMTRLQRMAGFDIILFPGTGARMRTTAEEVRANVRACLEPLGPIRPCLPVPGGSSGPADLPETLALVGSPDFGLVPGRAVFSHPSGPTAGARAFRQAWEALRAGKSLPEAAAGLKELRESLESGPSD